MHATAMPFEFVSHGGGTCSTDDIVPFCYRACQEVEKILNRRLDKRAFVLDPEKNQVLIREKTIDSLIDKVEDRVFRARKYANTCLLICFLIIYLVMLFLQNDITQAFTMESSAANQIGVGLPPGFYLENADDFWNWLDGNVINKVFSDPSCGDGVCDIGESKGFGRFGCEQDCGRYLETTPISVNLVPYINASKDISPNWPWDNVPQRETPEYRWNIWSETMNDYIYAEDQVAGKGIVVVDVPDGKMSLKLYQTNKISEVVDTTTIQDYLGFSPPTVPPRQATNDFAYGDPREVIAASALLMKQVQDYCWGMDPSNFDFMCLLHPITDSLYKSLASYGPQGTVSMPNGTKDRIELVNAGFCGMLPNGTQVQYDLNALLIPVFQSLSLSLSPTHRPAFSLIPISHLLTSSYLLPPLSSWSFHPSLGVSCLLRVPLFAAYILSMSFNYDAVEIRFQRQPVHASACTQVRVRIG